MKQCRVYIPIVVRRHDVFYEMRGFGKSRPVLCSGSMVYSNYFIQTCESLRTQAYSLSNLRRRAFPMWVAKEKTQTPMSNHCAVLRSMFTSAMLNVLLNLMNHKRG